MNPYLALLLTLVLVSCQNSAIRNEPVSYPLENIDIKTDQLADLVRLYGEPINRSETSAKLLKYDYGAFQVTAAGDGRLNSIMIQTTDFVDVNGLKVGQSRNQVIRTISKENILIDPSGAWLGDAAHRIIYWLDNDTVTMIVLAADL